MSEVKFKHFPTRPAKLTAKFAASEYEKLLNRLSDAESASSPEGWFKLFTDWDELESYIGSEGARFNFVFSQDMSNKEAEKEEKYFREKIVPAITKPSHELMKAFLKSKHRPALAKRYGKQLVVDYELALKPSDPINTDLRVKAGNVISEYEKSIAGASVIVNNKKVNLYKARSFAFSDNQKIREAAYKAVGDWVLANQEELANYYDQLVKLRNKMAKNLNYDSYVEMAYPLRGRTDYQEKDVESFRLGVLKYLVPIFNEYVESKAKRLKKPAIKPWDIMYDPQLSIPMGSAPVGEQLDRAEKLFRDVSPKLAKHFRFMRQNNLIDLETRPNKQAGAYCTQFTDSDEVLIFCNSTGDADDVRVLTHEMGHAFQAWESSHIEATDLRWGTADLAEIYSMGMEFLSLPYISRFFNQEDSLKYAEYKWVDSLYTTCYVCVVDEYQHWVYRHPKATYMDRDAQWIKIYQKYLGVIDFMGAEKYQATRWYLQSHIYSVPFYYIDYALAETCAMQLGMLDSTDHKKAVDTYLRLCKIGGTMSFLKAVKYGGLQSPFQEATLKKLAGHIRKQLI